MIVIVVLSCTTSTVALAPRQTTTVFLVVLPAGLLLRKLHDRLHGTLIPTRFACEVLHVPDVLVESFVVGDALDGLT